MDGDGVTIEQSYPLSPMQQGMLYNSLSSDSAGVDVEQMVCTLREPLDPARLREAWNRVTRRHPILRTAFRWSNADATVNSSSNDEPVQEVHASVELPFEEQDLRGVGDADERKARVEALIAADRARGFRLDRAPLMRFTLLRREDELWDLVWTFHHALLDGRSFPLVLNEVFGILDGQTEPASPRAYRDYIEWLHRSDPEPSREQTDAFWRENLKGFRAPTPLGGARALGPESGAPSYAEREIRIPASETSSFYQMAQNHQFTLNTLVQGAWTLLLSRYSNETDIVFGATRACRRTALGGDGTDNMIGILINTVPVRMPVDPDRTVREFLADLRVRWRSLRDHEHTPLVQIRKSSELPAGAALFDTLLVYEDYLLDTSLRGQGGAWKNRSFRLLEQTGFPLTLAGYGGPELLLKLEYDRRRFDDEFIERMLGHLRALLNGIAKNPELPVGDLPILSPEEFQRIVVESNETAEDFPRDKCMHQLFEAQVDRTPDAIALSRAGKTLTYRELDERANKLAHYLRAQMNLGTETKPGEEPLVAVCCSRSLDMLVGLFAILKAGAAYVPLDPNYPKARIEAIVEDARPRVILTQSIVESSLPDSSAAREARIIRLDTDWKDVEPHSTARPSGGASAGNLGYVIYTSGSTGKPKGVALEHHSAVAMIAWSRGIFTDAELRGVLFSTSVCFDLSVYEMFVTLAYGGKLIIAENALELPHLVERDEVTLVNTVPTAINELSLMKAIPPSVTTVNLAGEPLPLALAQQVYASQPSIERVYNLYGPTEDTTYSTWVMVKRGQTTPVTIGRIMSNSQAYILDARRQPLPIGIPGELYLGGEGLARYYLNRPELTGEKFVANPFAVETNHTNDYGARCYRTGDLCKWLPNGEIDYLGRIDHQVKVRGFRIELGEIETVLLQHAGVKETVVVAREDTPGDKRLVAYYAGPEVGTTATAAELHSHLKERLPDFMVPAAFVMMAKLPQTPNGKIDRKALPAPDVTATAASTAVRKAPGGAVEQVLVDLFGKVLGVDPERVSVDDSFFELGGHSLLALRLITKIEQSFGKRIPLPALIQAPTPAALAALLKQEKIAGAVVRINPKNPKRNPLFWCGQSYNQVQLFGQLIGQDQPLYGLESSFYDIRDPKTHVQDVAKRYVDEILEVEPEGPYLLGGFCIDALVAFEIAQILREKGKTVDLVAIVERDGPDPTYKRYRSVATVYHYHRKELAGRGFSERVQYVTERLKRIPDAIGIIARRERGEAPAESEAARLTDEEINSRKAFAARSSYKPSQPYDGPVAFFFAQETLDEIPRRLFPWFGWDRTITGPKAVHVIPGDHDTIGDEPHMRLLANDVRGCLDAAHGR